MNDEVKKDLGDRDKLLAAPALLVLTGYAICALYFYLTGFWWAIGAEASYLGYVLGMYKEYDSWGPILVIVCILVAIVWIIYYRIIIARICRIFVYVKECGRWRLAYIIELICWYVIIIAIVVIFIVNILAFFWLF